MNWTDFFTSSPIQRGAHLNHMRYIKLPFSPKLHHVLRNKSDAIALVHKVRRSDFGRRFE